MLTSMKDDNTEIKERRIRLWLSYSREESEKIVSYIAENDCCSLIKGNRLWKKMEEDQICDRSWLSIKTQFLTKIYPNIESFKISDEARKKIDEIINSLKSESSLHVQPHEHEHDDDDEEEEGMRFGKFYTLDEDLIIIRYILRKSRYLIVCGNSLWQRMEVKGVLPARSWQSMRNRYLTYIRKSLKVYSEYITKSDIEKLRVNTVEKKKQLDIHKSEIASTMKNPGESKQSINDLGTHSSNLAEPNLECPQQCGLKALTHSQHNSSLHMESHQRGWRRNVKFYTLEDDLVIIQYILHKSRYLNCCGNSLWKRMEAKNVLPDRTWQSMRNRYLTYIRESLDVYTQYIKKSDIEKLRGISNTEIEHRKIEHHKIKPSETNQNIISPSTLARNKSIEMRKMAVALSIQLYAAMKNAGQLK